jgi:DNA-binding response OmpR family regulator
MDTAPETAELPAPPSVPHVLIVDANSTVRDMFGRYLGFAGMAVRYAANGAAALAAAQADRPDLILCDLDLPGLTGVELCRAVQGDAATAGVPILIVSDGGPAGLETAVAAGCEVLARPCSQTLLVATIRQILARSPRASGT